MPPQVEWQNTLAGFPLKKSANAPRLLDHATDFPGFPGHAPVILAVGGIAKIIAAIAVAADT